MMQLMISCRVLELQYLPATWGTIVIIAILVLIIKFIVDWFLKTEVGLAIRATGDNKKMIRSFSANTDTLCHYRTWFFQCT